MKESRRPVGRPSKIDRDAAIFIARWWRTECLKESASKADQWIIDHWAERTPQGARPGITDGAHVRAAIRRASRSWLVGARFICNDGIRLSSDAVFSLDDTRNYWVDVHKLPGDFEIDGCAITAIEFVLHHCPRTWSWMPGITEAQRGYLRPIETSERGYEPSAIERQGRTQVAAGIAEYVGLLRLRRLDRLHSSHRQWLFGRG